MPSARTFRRSAFALLILLATSCGWLAWNYAKAVEQARIVSAVERVGGFAVHGDSFAWRHLRWLEGIVGIDMLVGINSVDLQYCRNRESVLCEVGKLQGVEWLCLSHGNLDDEDIKSIGKLAQLRLLHIDNAMIADERSLSHVAELKHLERLQLRFAGIGDLGLAKLAPLVTLRDLDVSINTSITDAAIPELLKLRELRCLNLNGAKITNQGLAILQGLPYLSSLEIGTTDINDDGLEVLSRFDQLRFLELSDTSISNRGLDQSATTGRA
ncbi:MAG: hypothetical protein JSS27_19385, partial [Planctomycetes bacterium]|nr:hypothetical protein [Planctomycetota bacterium]